MDCLNRNDYNRDKCLDFFEAYKECKKTWVSCLIFLQISFIFFSCVFAFAMYLIRTSDTKFSSNSSNKDVKMD